MKDREAECSGSPEEGCMGGATQDQVGKNRQWRVQGTQAKGAEVRRRGARHSTERGLDTVGGQ